MQLPSSWPPVCVGSGVRVAVFDTTSARSVQSVRSVSSAKNADLIDILHTNALARSPDEACLSVGLQNGPLGPKALHMDPKCVPRWPKGDQSRPKGVPMGSQGWPKTTKGSPAGPNYISKLPINRPSGHYVTLYIHNLPIRLLGIQYYMLDLPYYIIST